MVIYTLTDRKWQVSCADGGWSEVHLYRDDSDGSCRLVGWAVNNQDIMLNANITKSCIYRRKSGDFHKFQDESGAGWGFGFHKGPEAVRLAQELSQAVMNAIDSLQENVPSPPVAPQPVRPQAQKPPQKSATAMRVTVESADTRTNGDNRESMSRRGTVLVPATHEQQLTTDIATMLKGKKPMGKLAVLPSKPARQNFEDGVSKLTITDPYDITHNKHASFDAKTRQYSGLPDEWVAKLQVQFGIDPSQVDSIKLPEYEARIPAVLVELKKYFDKHNGPQSTGIFRLAPDASECKAVKEQLNKGAWDSESGSTDINVVANLIKVWFRDLPKQLLGPHVVDPALIAQVNSVDSASRVVLELPVQNRSLLLWLLDLCCCVAQHKAQNNMGSRNLAICISPNLMDPSKLGLENPMAAMMFSQKVASFMRFAIDWRWKGDSS